MAIALEFAIFGKGVNLLLISISAICLFFNLNKLIDLSNRYLYIYLLGISLLLPLFTNYDSFRLTTFFYGLMFLGVYKIIIVTLERSYITLEAYKKFLLFIITIFTVVAILQYILYKYGIAFNMIWELDRGIFRANSLSTEPSYAGIIMVISFYSYIVLQKSSQIKNNISSIFSKYWIYWLLLLIVLFLTRSGYAFVFFTLLILGFIKYNKFLIFLIIGILIGSIILADYFEPINRVLNLFKSLFTLDLDKMVMADHSGSIRVAPVFIFFEDFDFFAIQSWVGYGMNYSKFLMADIIPGIELEHWNGGGFFPSFVYDYGVLAGIIFFLFIKKNVIGSFFSIEFLFIFLLILNTSFNSQLFWFSIIIFSANKYFLKKTYFK